MQKKGLILIFTGHGKGKTTAALGMTMRAAGHGLKTCFIQFIKGNWKYGETEAMVHFRKEIDFHVMGRGFTWKSDDLEKDKAVAREAWAKAKGAIFSGRYQTVVLDEFTYLLSYGMINTVHLTLSLSGDYIHLSKKNGMKLEDDFWQRLSTARSHVSRINPHDPFTDPSIGHLLDYCRPKHIIFEFTFKGLAAWEKKTAKQKQAMARLWE
jgi:cob(I)alamin adenosyltransferase